MTNVVKRVLDTLQTMSHQGAKVARWLIMMFQRWLLGHQAKR